MDRGDVRCSWVRTVAPIIEPLSMEEAKLQARITATDGDALIASYIATAREAAEEYMNRGLITQTWKLVLDNFADVIPLPMAAPLQSVTSVTYYDENGTQQTLSTTYYGTDTVSRPGAVVLKVDQSWPGVQVARLNGTVEITYVVGWTTAELVPERIKQGLRQYVTYLDLDRDGLESRALEAMQAAERCWSDRVWWSAPQAIGC